MTVERREDLKFGEVSKRLKRFAKRGHGLSPTMTDILTHISEAYMPVDSKPQ